MNYVMSDLHGCYTKYKQMLEQIHFSDDDTLHILGDIGDRGEDSAKIFLDILERKNVFAIKGNHEVMAETHLEYLLSRHEENGLDMLELFSERNLWLWFENGGDTTIASLMAEPEINRLRILDFICDLPYYRIVEAAGNHYVLVHGGLGEYTEGTPLEEVSKRDLVWSRPDYNGRYFDGENTYLVVGHTPTFLFNTNSEQPASIYRGRGNVIAVDCGAVYPDCCGRLGCLCLETGEEFYV